jgi:hypothetical protein
LARQGFLYAGEKELISLASSTPGALPFALMGFE